MTKSLIVIENKVVEVTDFTDNGFGGFIITCDNGCEYQVFSSSDEAGEAASRYWRELAENDPEEFRCLIGDENLINWALGQWAGPGDQQTRSLEDWFALTEQYPEEQWASYDGQEIEGARFNKHFADETDFEDRENIVLYRSF